MLGDGPHATAWLRKARRRITGEGWVGRYMGPPPWGLLRCSMGRLVPLPACLTSTPAET